MKFELTKPVVICAFSVLLVGLVWTIDPIGAYLIMTLAAAIWMRIKLEKLAKERAK